LWTLGLQIFNALYINAWGVSRATLKELTMLDTLDVSAKQHNSP